MQEALFRHRWEEARSAIGERLAAACLLRCCITVAGANAIASWCSAACGPGAWCRSRHPRTVPLVSPLLYYLRPESITGLADRVQHVPSPRALQARWRCTSPSSPQPCWLSALELIDRLRSIRSRHEGMGRARTDALGVKATLSTSPWPCDCGCKGNTSSKSGTLVDKVLIAMNSPWSEGLRVGSCTPLPPTFGSHASTGSCRDLRQNLFGTDHRGPTVSECRILSSVPPWQPLDSLICQRIT